MMLLRLAAALDLIPRGRGGEPGPDRFWGGAPPGGHTHNVGALGLEGVGAAGVEVRAVVALQEAHVVEAIGLGGVEKQLVKGVGAEGGHTHRGAL